jgi:hypothetical protein
VSYGHASSTIRLYLHVSSFKDRHLARLSDGPLIRSDSSSECIGGRPFCIILTYFRRFREMCEDAPAVKALNFLQNDVSSTVDHNSSEETSTFRSLLSHLLIPPKPPTLADSHQPSGPDTAGADSEPEDNDDEPPKKRSRQSTPEEAWTSMLDDEGIIVACAPNPLAHSNRAIVSMKEDPEEKGMRDAASSLSAERFQQRTEVFESLLQFVGEDAKQPSGNLLDMMHGVEDL